MLPWSDIDTALLDMDGTLLDRHFDDYFWEEHVPKKYAEENNISFDNARRKLLTAYKSEEKTLNWTDVNYWSNRLRLNVVALKEEIRGQVRIHPGVEAFLKFLKGERKEIILVTNAHPKTVQIKMAQTGLLPFFRTVLCSSDIGLPKEEIGFWRDAEKVLQFDKGRSLLVDDNEDVLLAAQVFGIKYLRHKSGASSRAVHEVSEMFQAVRYFTELIP